MKHHDKLVLSKQQLELDMSPAELTKKQKIKNRISGAVTRLPPFLTASIVVSLSALGFKYIGNWLLSWLLNFTFPIFSLTREAKEWIGFGISVVICSFGGWVAYQLRERFRLAYAIVEIAAAAGSATLVFHGRIDGTQSPSTFLVGILGALYIAVRGYDNLFKGYAEYTPAKK